MSKVIFLRLVACFLCVGQLILPPLAMAEQLSLPSADKKAPNIIHDPSDNSIRAGKPFVVSATVKDDNYVAKVVIYYRTKGESNYKSAIMSRLGKRDIYSTTLAADTIQEPGIEYYITAVDAAGNTGLYGLRFDPKTIAVVSSTAATSVAVSPSGGHSSPVTEEKSWIQKNWLWVGLGVAVVAAAAGGGGGGGDSAPDGGGINSETGSITIVAPIPE